MGQRGARYWIDGWNVLLRLGMGEGAELRERRSELVARVAALGRPAWIAFDSRESHLGLGSARPRRVEVVFAPPGTSADALLVEKVRRAPRLDGVVVVSDDREVAERCRILGARTMGAATFGALLRPVPEPTPRKERPLTPDEVKDWMEWFGRKPRE